MINKLKSFFVKNNKFLPIIIILVVLIVFAIIATVYLTKTVNTSIYDERKSSLSTTTEASAKTVDTEIISEQNKANTFSNSAEHFLSEDTTLKEVIDTLNNIYNLTDDKFFFVDSNGNYYCSDGNSGFISGDLAYYTPSTDTILKYIGTLPHITTLTVDQNATNYYEDKTYIIFRNKFVDNTDNAKSYSIKVEEGGAVVDICFCAYMCDLGELNEIVTSLYAGKNNTFIYDKTSGTMLYKQFDLGLLMDGYNIYYKYKNITLVNGENADDIIADCKADKVSITEMQINGENYYACSAPLSAYDDWSLFFVVEKSNVESASGVGFKRVVYTSLAVAIILCVVVIVLALYMFFYRRNRDKLLNQEILMEKQSELEKALKMAENASRAKTSFLFNMSHDIRTPMNAIMGFTNMAKKNIDNPEKVLECLEKTQKSNEVLLSLINDVLEMSRIESGKVTLAKDEVDIINSFTSIKPMSDELAKAKNINLTFDFDIKNRYVIMDELRTQRLCMNIISNGIKYTQDGGYVHVKVTEQECEKEGYATYLYTFADNGIGMSEDFQQKLFDEYEREETSATREIQGTGLGLALCKSLIEIMGGDITVESKLGEGTTFSITLTFKLSDESHHTVATTEDTDYADITGKKVLVVEDNAFNREICRDLLEEMGLVVDEAEDGALAVEKLKEVGIDYFDYILMDIQMPNMDGYEATKEIRSLFKRHIPIFALSANAFEEDKEKSRNLGMDEHLAKPIVQAQILEMLKKYNNK